MKDEKKKYIPISIYLSIYLYIYKTKFPEFFNNLSFVENIEFFYINIPAPFFHNEPHQRRQPARFAGLRVCQVCHQRQ